MPENPQAKNELRLQQATRIVATLIDTFGEAMLLDALAIALKTPDGRKLLEASATLTRALDQPDEELLKLDKLD